MHENGSSKSNSLQDFRASNYERPDLPWVCGHAAQGGCPLGPTLDGQCVTRWICEPIQQGGQWKCARSRMQGGPCEPGPTDDGQCGCEIGPCNPRRSLRSIRGRFAFAVFAAILGMTAVLLSSNARNNFLAPGALTEPHALILNQEGSHRCSKCHSAGHRNFGNWLLASVIGPPAASASQTTLCMECHQKNFPVESASQPHSVPVARLHTWTRDALKRTGADPMLALRSHEAPEVACSVCHQEHHGALHDLTAMSNQHCQVCHHEQFESFANGHPEFDGWPYARRSRLIFDHSSHLHRHFPKANQTFDCSTCHVADAEGEPRLISSFEQNCASCHESDLETSLEEPFVFLRLPVLDRDVFEREGLSIGQWPAHLIGDFDGAISPMTLAMLWADPLARASLKQFEAGFDFFDLDINNFDDLEAASELVWSLKRLLRDLHLHGASTIYERARITLEESDAPPLDLDVLAARFNPNAVARLTAMFPAFDTELADHSRIFARTRNDDRSKPDVSAATVRWNHSEDHSELLVNMSGHRNVALQAWLDLLARMDDEARSHCQPFLQPTSAGKCMMCHSAEYAEGRHDVAIINWRASRASAGGELTRFRHSAHALHEETSRCETCHQVNLETKYVESFASLDPHHGCTGFHDMTKADCAACHVKNAAGDACLKCHQYHAGTESAVHD